MKTRVYTIEFGRFHDCGEQGIYQECTNQPSFISLEEATKELNLYFGLCGLYFPDTFETNSHADGYYIELYIGDFNLTQGQIDRINNENDLPNAVSSSKLCNEIVVDKCGKIIKYEINNYLE